MRLQARVKTKTMEELLAVQRAIDEIIQAGGRVGLNDPLTHELYRLRKKLARGE